MPHTTRVGAPLARFVLEQGDEDLRRRIAILRQKPFPPGSRSLDADGDWRELAQVFPNIQGFIYGTNEGAVVYTYDSSREVLSIEFGVRNGSIVGRLGS